jgi:hypothetical protein
MSDAHTWFGSQTGIPFGLEFFVVPLSHTQLYASLIVSRKEERSTLFSC